MRRRKGITLLEVLSAITICSVGLLALMTLFPLAAIEMATSVRQDRCGHIKHTAASVANIFDVRNDPTIQAKMLNPGGGLVPLNPLSSIDGENPSYPVFVDPIGWNTNIATPNGWGGWVGGSPGGGLPRLTIKELNPYSGADPQYNLTQPAYMKQQQYRWFVALDEINFRHDDEASLGLACSPGTVVERTPRYSYALLVQLPKARIPTAAELTVVIYSGRALEEPGVGETAFAATFNPATNLISLSWGAGQTAPDIGVGTWLLDSTMTAPVPRTRFYRAVGFTQTSPTTADVEVLSPPTPLAAGTITPRNGSITVMDNVIEVYVRGDY